MTRFFSTPYLYLYILLAYLPFLGNFSVPLTGDQKVYISTALEMFLHQEWAYPILFGDHSYFKPPLQYWATLSSWNLIGLSTFSTLLPSVLALLFSVFFIHRISQTLNHNSGKFSDSVFSGLAFAGCMGAVTYGTTAQMEIYLVLFYAASWSFLLAFLAQSKFRFLYLAFVCAGLMSLVKSPIYSVFWVMSGFLFLFLRKEYAVLKNKHTYLSLLCGTLTGLTWYVFVLVTDQPQFLNDYVFRENIQKVWNHQGTTLKLWFDFLMFCFPFTLLIIPYGIKLFKKTANTKTNHLLLSWILFPALFFSLFPYKTETYLFIIIPAWMIAIQEGMQNYRKETHPPALKWSYRLTGILALLLVGMVSWVLYRAELLSPLVLLGFLLSGIFFFISNFKMKWKWVAVSSLSLILFFRIIGTTIGEQDLHDLRQFVKQNQNTPLAYVDPQQNIWHEVGMVSAAIKKPIQRLRTYPNVSHHLKRNGAILLDKNELHHVIKVIQPSKLHLTPWRRWKRRVQFPYKKLIIDGRKNISNWNELTKREFVIITLGSP